jgi:hypothetical protein
MSKQSPKKVSKRRNRFPPGWDDARVRRLLAHYESMDEKHEAMEDEAAYKTLGQTMMSVPTELVPAVRKLIARKNGSS